MIGVAGLSLLGPAAGAMLVAFDEGVAYVRRSTDLAHTGPVQYSGIHPDLFREGQGVVGAGRLGRDSAFKASEVLAKHDGTDMPPEAAVALKSGGQRSGGADQ